MLTCALPILSVAAHAAEGQQNWWNGEYIFSGARGKELRDRGYTLFAIYDAIVANNVSGGIDPGTAYAQNLYFGVKLDLQRLLGINPTTVTVSRVDRAGSGIIEDVGSIYSVMQLVSGQTIFLYNVQIETNWWDGELSLKLGVYQLTSYMFDASRNGLDLSFSESGISVLTELDWLLDWQGKPGHLAVGANSASYPMPRFIGNGIRNPFFRYYLQADQQVYAETPGSDQGLVLLLTLTYSPYEDAAQVPFQASFGAIYQGLVSGRNKDRLIFGATYGDLSSNYAAQQQARVQGYPTYELPLELGYRLHLSKSAYFQPDIQYGIRPGGTGDIPDATVAGAQFGLSF